MKKGHNFKKIASAVMAAAMVSSVSPVVFAADTSALDTTQPVMTAKAAQDINLVSFPGAEGGGKYTTGGRGCEVYHVTNLNDDGEGSLRDAVSQPNRMIIFDVSGTVKLKSVLNLTQPNITIAGQTAPGDGVCIADYNIVISADNIIMRYLRFRPGDISGAENDAVSSRYCKNIMVDHCSTSWSTDETLSLYAVADASVQWCIASESLTLAVHAKGRHGYGGIWGGANVSYHHNLVATHTSRMPRYASASSTHPDYVGINENDMVNNVLYNWGFNNSYGAEEATVNVINNYYKSGPITNAGVLGRIWNPSKAGRFYFNGNVLEGNEDVTNNNLLGVQLNEGAVPPEYLNEPIYDILYPLDKVDTAEEAYTKVLADAGATVPKRDSYDAKIVNDVKNSTGRAINNESEAGGWPVLNSMEAPIDTDRDGMPDAYEESNGLDKNDSSDGKVFAENGYTNLENYINGIVEETSVPHNPTVSLDVENNACYTKGSDIELSATATADTSEDKTNTIEKVEFYRDDVLLGEATTVPYKFTYKNADGEIGYMSARAIDKNGEATTSEIKAININGTGSVDPWKTMDIGTSTINGSYSQENGVYTVKSSGLIGAGNEFNVAEGDAGKDAFSYMYQNIDENGAISTKIDSVSKLNNNSVSGLMIRDELTENSDFVMLNYEYEKGGAGLAFDYRINGEYKSDFLKLEVLPRYIKLVKEGNHVTGYHSENGIDWNSFGEVTMDYTGTNYAGVCQDGNKETNQISTFAWGKFSDLSLENYGQNAIPEVDISVSTNRNSISANQGQFLVGDELSVDVSTNDGETLKKVEIYVDGNLYAEDAQSPFSCTLSGLTAGSHYVSVIAYDNDGAKNTATKSIGVSDVNMQGMDVIGIGNTKMKGAFDFSQPGKITVYGTGYGVADTLTEEYPYAYMSMSGNFTASFKIDDWTVEDYDHVGFMLRDGLSAGDTSYAYYFQKYNGEIFASNSSVETKYKLLGQQKYKKAPVWLKISKSGSTVTSEYSQDGVNWVKVGSEEVTLGDTFYFGLFGASAEEYKVSKFDLSEFTISNTVYNDTEGFDWAIPAIENLTSQNIVSGDGNGNFCPEQNVTRAEFAKMIIGAYELKNQNVNSSKDLAGFNDITSDDWYFDYINKAYAYNLVNGVTDKTFEPNREITREEMATMICRAMGSQGNYGELEMNFNDLLTISDWAVPFVDVLYRHGIMKGDQNGNFNPLNFANRAEAAQVIYNFLTI